MMFLIIKGVDIPEEQEGQEPKALGASARLCEIGAECDVIVFQGEKWTRIFYPERRAGKDCERGNHEGGGFQLA